MSQWQPISSVPKTGEVVLFWDGHRLSTGRADDWHYRAVYLDRATHWHVLPPPPQQEEGQNR